MGITLPDEWVDAGLQAQEDLPEDVQRPLQEEPVGADKCLLAKNDLSYLAFSKDIIADDRLIGDAFCENEEIFVVTEKDVEG